MCPRHLPLSFNSNLSVSPSWYTSVKGLCLVSYNPDKHNYAPFLWLQLKYILKHKRQYVLGMKECFSRKNASAEILYSCQQITNSISLKHTCTQGTYIFNDKTLFCQYVLSFPNSSTDIITQLSNCSQCHDVHTFPLESIFAADPKSASLM